MNEIDRPYNLKRFYLQWQKLNHVYEDYAKIHDLTYISMFINPKDRRSRLIVLTERGKEFQQKVISHIEQAELQAFASLSEREQEVITDLWEKYTSICINKINGS